MLDLFPQSLHSGERSSMPSPVGGRLFHTHCVTNSRNGTQDDPPKPQTPATRSPAPCSVSIDNRGNDREADTEIQGSGQCGEDDDRKTTARSGRAHRFSDSGIPHPLTLFQWVCLFVPDIRP